MFDEKLFETLKRMFKVRHVEITREQAADAFALPDMRVFYAVEGEFQGRPVKILLACSDTPSVIV